jgi:uncharacterized membrane protein YsdA (DUF1294 family)
MNGVDATSVLIFLIVVNAATWVAFWADKRAAQKGAWRIPEKTLLGLAAFGGTLAAFHARQKLRHKTRKQPFSAYLYGIALCQVIVGIAMLAGEDLFQYLR